jgi:hypothetical protein
MTKLVAMTQLRLLPLLQRNHLRPPQVPTPTARKQEATVEADMATAMVVDVEETTAAAKETVNLLLHQRLGQLAHSLLQLYLKLHALAARLTLTVNLIAVSTILTLLWHGGARSASQMPLQQRLLQLIILLHLETTSLSSLLL